LSIIFDLERTNQLSLLPDKDLVDLCPPIEPYQVTKNQVYKLRERLKEGDQYKTKPQIGGELIKKLKEMGFKIKLVLADSE